MTFKKSIILYILLTLVSALFFSYSLVFALPIASKEYKFYSPSNNVFIDSLPLWSNYLITNKYFTDYKITWECSAFWELIWKNGDNSVFRIKFLKKDCDKSKVSVKIDLDGLILKKEFNLISNYKLYSTYLDSKNSNLEKTNNSIDLKISELGSLEKSIKIKRNLSELNYLKNFLQDIIEKRKQKYKIPVLWAPLPTQKHKIPNTWRPYRESYTDGVHHWWDFDAKKWDSVISLDDGIVIKVVNNFLFSDLWNIDKSENLTEEQKLINLDILRWNQVWVKTMKWDVAFYSHLDEVFDDIKVGTTISKGQPIWTIWITWVPDKNYSDYHLHIPVHKNPYINSKAGKYTEMDYMKWDWYFKWKSLDYVLENQKNIFEK